MTKRMILYIVCAFMFAGCATKREAQTIYKVVEVHDTLTRELERVDSVFLRDSVRIWMAGDTIHHDRWRVEYRDRWRDRVQEVVKIKTDTIMQYEVVEKDSRTPWQRAKSCAVWYIGGLLSMFLITLGFRLRNGSR